MNILPTFQDAFACVTASCGRSAKKLKHISEGVDEMLETEQERLDTMAKAAAKMSEHYLADMASKNTLISSGREAVRAGNTQIGGLEAALQAKSEEAATLEAEVDMLAEAKATLEDTVILERQNVQTGTTEMGVVEKALEAKSEEFATLELEVDLLSTDKATLEDSVADLKKKLANQEPALAYYVGATASLQARFTTTAVVRRGTALVGTRAERKRCGRHGKRLEHFVVKMAAQVATSEAAGGQDRNTVW